MGEVLHSYIIRISAFIGNVEVTVCTSISRRSVERTIVEACNRKEQTEYYLDILLEGDLDERIEFVKNKGEEVKAIEKRLEQHRRRDNHENGIGSSNNGERLVS